MTEENAAAPKRPILVWVIFLFYLISSIQVIVGLFFITAGGVEMTPESQAYLATFTVWDRVIGYLNAGVTLVGVSLLFALRRQAVNVLALAFALNLFSTALVWLRNNPAAYIAPTGLAAQAVGIAIFGAVVYYSWRLLKRGVLYR